MKKVKLVLFLVFLSTCLAQSKDSLTSHTIPSRFLQVACAMGEYESGSKCLPCIHNCRSCTSDTNCITCKDGNYRYSATLCNGCHQNCKTCSSAWSCDSCNPGYYLVPTATHITSGSCYSCVAKNCDKCTGGGVTQCTICRTGFYLSGGECLVDTSASSNQSSSTTTSSSKLPTYAIVIIAVVGLVILVGVVWAICSCAKRAKETNPDGRGIAYKAGRHDQSEVMCNEKPVELSTNPFFVENSVSNTTNQHYKGNNYRNNEFSNGTQVVSAPVLPPGFEASTNVAYPSPPPSLPPGFLEGDRRAPPQVLPSVVYPSYDEM